MGSGSGSCCCGSTVPCDINDIPTSLTLTVSKLTGSGTGSSFFDAFIGTTSLTWSTVANGIIVTRTGNVSMSSEWASSCVAVTFTYTLPFFPFTSTTYNYYAKPILACTKAWKGVAYNNSETLYDGPQTLYFNVSIDTTSGGCGTKNTINVPYYGLVSNQSISYAPYLHVYDYTIEANSSQYPDNFRTQGQYRITISE